MSQYEDHLDVHKPDNGTVNQGEEEASKMVRSDSENITFKDRTDSVIMESRQQRL
jgi:hypothetical protein